MGRRLSISFRPMRTLLGRRDILLTLAGLTLIYLYYTSNTASTRVPPESVRLARFMNDNPPPVPSTPSSFNWSSIKFTPPTRPGAPTKLPSSYPKKLRPIQLSPFPRETPEQYATREARRHEVRKLFQHNWASYRKHAWLSDALLPISGKGRNQFSGWAATLVDALDTLWILGLRDDFDEAVAAVAKIDFGTSTTDNVNMFETNIRYLGGLLGAYDLSGRPVLLEKARELGDMLYAGFNTPNGMPVDFFSMVLSKSGNGLTVENSVANAGPGTLTMEFTRLSQITGDQKYYAAIANLVSLFEEGQMRTMQPGLWPTTISLRTQNVVDGRSFTLGAGADSTYEYMTKMYPLLAGREQRYRTMSNAWMDAADKSMLYRPMLPGEADILFAGNLDFNAAGTGNLDPESEHLTCFLGGTFALGGKLFDKPEYIATGAKLARGCAYAYKATPTGMMCERFNMVKCASRKPPCAWDEKKWEEEKASRGLWKEGVPLGFSTCKDPRYILRPEAIESIFYLWRITGDPFYQETAWEMFTATGNGTLTEFGNAAVMDVTSTEKPLKMEDYMEVSTDPSLFGTLMC